STRSSSFVTASPTTYTSASTSSGAPPVRTARSSPPTRSSRASCSASRPATSSGRSWAERNSFTIPKTAAGFSGNAMSAAPERGAARVNREQHADGDEVGDHRRAADRDERQRDARDGCDPHRHPDVDEDLKQERDDDPAGDDRRKEVARNRDDSQRPPDDEQVEA